MRPRRLSSIAERVDLLKRHFPALVEAYDARTPFVRSGQLESHRQTILARRSAGSATAALGSDAFLALLYATLQKWGIGARRSRLAPFPLFASSLRRFQADVAALDRLKIDDPTLNVGDASARVLAMIEKLEIVDTKAPLVACTKALHHLLPDLVVPIDREYTQRFFGWHSPEFQYRQGEFLVQAFAAFADVARAANPQQYVRDSGWHTSRTKVIDNAIVSLLVMETDPEDRGSGKQPDAPDDVSASTMARPSQAMDDFAAVAEGLCALARACAGRGSVPATSGNFSAVVSRHPLRLAITPSGADKGALAPNEILEIDETGAVVRGHGRPSAETTLHLAVVRARDAGAVAHTHSLWATVLSARADTITIEGLEMLKALQGVTTHEHREVLPVVPNTQDWAQGARAVEEALARHQAAHGLLIRGHGLYTWGRDTREARRHVEALEYLLEVTGRGTWQS